MRKSGVILQDFISELFERAARRSEGMTYLHLKSPDSNLTATE
jgi:hypothetical protein